MWSEPELEDHQADFVDDIEAKILALSGGYGAGKTWTLCAWAVQRAFENNGAPVLLIEPTYPMVMDVLVPTMEEHLDHIGIRWEYSPSKKTFFVGRSRRKIICRSGEKPGRLKGLTVGCVGLDEFEMQREDVAKVALSRMRHRKATLRQLALVGTAEGFGWGYRWIEENRKPGTRVIYAKTRDNPHNGDDYEANVRAHLSEEEAAEKLDGVRMKPGGLVYTRFSRQVHHKDSPADLRDVAGDLELWCDFNVGKMCWALVLVDKRAEIAHVIDEIIGYDTDALEQAYRAIDHIANRLRISPEDVQQLKLTFIADGAAGNRSAGAPTTMIQQVTSAGFRPRYQPNPRVADRVASVQGALSFGRLLFDTRRTPYITKCFEQQARAPNGEPEKNNANPKEDLSHGADAVGYGIYMHWPASKPRANRPIGEARKPALPVFRRG